MTKSMAAFTLLVIVMRMDGNLTGQEFETIQNFLAQRNLVFTDVNSEEMFQQLMRGTISSVLQKFGEAAVFLQKSSTKEQLERVYNLILDLILADGKVTQDEMHLSAVLGGIWGFDSEQMMFDRMS